MPQDYYTILGIDPKAEPQQIKAAYRNLAFQYHPDRNRGDAASAEKMKRINEAYAVLSHPNKRQEYDRLRQQYGPSAYHQFRQSYSEQDIFKGSDIHQIFEEMARAFGLRGGEEIFKEFYGQGYRSFEFKRPGFFARGFIFSGFRQSYGWKKAAFLSSTIFALAHLQPVAFLPTFMLGYVFSYLYQKSNSILPGIFLHLLTNLFGLLSAFAFSQM